MSCDNARPMTDVSRPACQHHVYVVTLTDEDGRVKEQRVFASLFDADVAFRELRVLHGRFACLTSRVVEGG